jgi:ATP-dependent DNA ligase
LTGPEPPTYQPRPNSTDITDRELKRLAGVLAPLQVPKMLLAAPPPRDNRFGSPLKLSKVHWVRPEIVVEVTYLTWTEDNLLRQVSYQGQREDKPARQVVRSVPHGHIASIGRPLRPQATEPGASRAISIMAMRHG